MITFYCAGGREEAAVFLQHVRCPPPVWVAVVCVISYLLACLTRRLLLIVSATGLSIGRVIGRSRIPCRVSLSHDARVCPGRSTSQARYRR
jgi:hypothetical protein